MKYKYRVDRYIWLYPILMFLTTVFGFVAMKGTDLGGQLYALRFYEDYSIMDMIRLNFLEEEKILFYLIYNFLHVALGVQPRLYIGVWVITYFLFVVLILRTYLNNKDLGLRMNTASNLCVFTMLSLCPILFTISRYFSSVVFVYVSILLYLKRKYLAAIIPLVLSYFTHEGILVIFAIISLGFFLYRFWLRKNKNYNIRNTIIVILCIVFLLLGSTYFATITGFLYSEGVLSEHYMDTYGTMAAGDGVYKLVIVLSMLGPLICLFANSLIDKRNDFVYGITVSGLLMVCLLYNQKIFYVQRIMMFMPLFIGLTSFQICADQIKQQGKINPLYLIIMLLVPANLLFQFVIQFNLYFGNLFL